MSDFGKKSPVGQIGIPILYKIRMPVLIGSHLIDTITSVHLHSKKILEDAIEKIIYCLVVLLFQCLALGEY